MRPDPSANPSRKYSQALRPDKIPSFKSQNVAATRAESPSVQDRIRQWQAQGAADALAPDNLSVRSIPLSDCPPVASRPQSPYGDSSTQEARGRSEEKVDSLPNGSRSQSTPRKRIISDGHWKARRKEQERKDSATGSKQQPQSPRFDLSYTSTSKDPKYHHNSEQQGATMDSKPNPRDSAGGGGDDGIRVTPLVNPISYSLRDDIPYDTESRIDEALALDLTPESVYSVDIETRSNTSNLLEQHDSVPRRTSKYVQTLGRTPSSLQDGILSKTKKGKFFGKTKDLLFMKSEDAPPGSNRVPSIEAWLEEQPDPFIDQDDRGELPAVEIPRPLRKRSERQQSPKDTTPILDPNKIWESVQSRQSPVSPSPQELKFSDPHRRRSSNSPQGTPLRPSSGVTANCEDGDGSPSGLRRRGARVRRQRESSTRNTPVEKISSESAQNGEQQATSVVTKEHSGLAHDSCPPISSHPHSTAESVEAFRDDQAIATTQDQPSDQGCTLQRRLTTHEDLMSVLSISRRGRSLRSAKSIRAVRQSRKSASAQEVLGSLISDEEKYARELRTLVDGVIPVLLQCVLSKSDSFAAAGLFTTSTTAKGDFSFTKPIIDMGIALERLRSLHSRMPFRDLDSLLKWAQTAQKAYADYLQAWRLGFQDVVVDLAPLDGVDESEAGLDRGDSGDLINAEGSKVDVAYLLKRPLVRVKALGKTFNHIRDECDRPLAITVASAYSDLTLLAKRRFQEEQARLEDEAAAEVDATRARDIKTLAATNGVLVDKTRRVRARDFFNLTLYHTSGQRIDCGIELIFRDNARGEPTGGDVLVCEVDDSGKWLLFAPIELNCISARRGEAGFDLVIMVRGRVGFNSEWHELLALKTDDSNAMTEWMTMLGSAPLPPRLNRTSSFVAKSPPLMIAPPSSKQDKEDSHEATKLSASMIDVDVPIGERSVIGTRSNTSRSSVSSIHKPLPSLNLGGGLVSAMTSRYSLPHTPPKKASALPLVPPARSTFSDRSHRETAGTLPALPDDTSAPGATSKVKSKAALFDVRPETALIPRSSKFGQHKGSTGLRRTDKDSREWMSSPIIRQAGGSEPIKKTDQEKYASWTGRSSETTNTPQKSGMLAPQRPEYKRTISSAPSKDLPTVSKVRSSGYQEFMDTAQQTSDRQDLDSHKSPKDSPEDTKIHEGYNTHLHTTSQTLTEVIAQPLQKADSTSVQPFEPTTGAHSPTSSSRSSQRKQMRSSNKPPLADKPVISPANKQVRRRTSSPLKHEYAPSASSDSSSDYDSDGVSDSSSDTSDDVRSEHGDTATPLVAIVGRQRYPSKSVPPPASLPSSGTRTLAPSDSASQGPYRKVPSSATVPMHKRSKTIALICSWSDRGMWEQVHPDECSVVISPGLIEAFEMSAAHSDPRIVGPLSKDVDARSSSPSQQPLVAFELTPIVPLRRGTALDISIRSPPTPNSKIQTTNNVMFRSRNPEECEALYGMINWARCNNPTYIQLQMARPVRQPSVSFNVGQHGHSRSRSSSWFSFGVQRKSSYRASSAPTPASIDMSVESSGTMASAFSALKRFTANSAFNVNRSSVLRRPGSVGAAGSLYSSTSGTASGSGTSTPAPSQLGFVPGKDGPNVPSTSAAAADGGGMINMMKIRLYVRKGQHWENLGAARLSVLPASTGDQFKGGENFTPRPTRPGTVVEGSPPATPAHGRSPSSVMTVGQPGQNRGPRLPSSSNTPHRIHGNGREKRIMIVKNKDREVVLLDSILGESCFERIMQTGIAVKVWNESEDISHTGGVTLGRETVYMMQFPGTREAGWVFNLCGTYRYGAGVSSE